MFVTHPIDALVSNDGITVRVLLAPVLCIDCNTYVPLGWVEYGTVRCPENFDANGVQYGHRVSTAVLTNAKDTIMNEVTR